MGGDVERDLRSVKFGACQASLVWEIGVVVHFAMQAWREGGGGTRGCSGFFSLLARRENVSEGWTRLVFAFLVLFSSYFR